MAAGKIDDAQAAMTEAEAAIDECPASVRSSMRECAHHAMEKCPIHGSLAEALHAGDATHCRNKGGGTE